MEFQTIHSVTLHQGRVFNLRQDQVRMPNGQLTTLDIIEHPKAVVLVPVDPDGQIVFVRQYRHAAGIFLLELPAGGTEPDESSEDSARREIREEIGMSAASLQLLGEYFISPGYSTEYLTIYLATGLQPDPLPGDEDEFISVERVPIRRALELAETGQIPDAKTLAALLLARRFLVSE